MVCERGPVLEPPSSADRHVQILVVLCVVVSGVLDAVLYRHTEEAKSVTATRREVERPAAPGNEPDWEPSAGVMMVGICVTWWSCLERVVFAAMFR